MLVISITILIFAVILYNSRNTLIIKKAAYESTLLYNELGGMKSDPIQLF